MKSFSTLVSIPVALFAAFILGCAKPPDQELQSAKAALDSALALQADTYAPSEYKNAKESLDGAIAEIDKQNSVSPLKKNYEKAKSLIASVTVAANNAKVRAVEGKKQAAAQADAALSTADSLLGEIKVLVEKARKDKAVEAIKNEIASTATTLGEAQSAKTSGDYLVALDKANSCSKTLDSLKNTLAAVGGKTPAKSK